jgi:hypothetical protein
MVLLSDIILVNIQGINPDISKFSSLPQPSQRKEQVCCNLVLFAIQKNRSVT